MYLLSGGSDGGRSQEGNELNIFVNSWLHILSFAPIKGSVFKFILCNLHIF